MTEQNQLNWQRDNFESIEEAWQGNQELLINQIHLDES